MHVIATCGFGLCFPRLDGDVTVGLRGQLQDNFASINIGLDFRHALGHAFVLHQTVEFAELLDLRLCVPRDTFAAIAHLVHQWAERSEALVDVRIVALHDGNLRRRFSGN